MLSKSTNNLTYRSLGTDQVAVGGMPGTQGFVDESSLISVPYTTIVNRAKIPNIAADLKASMGIERIPTQQIMQVQNEIGPNGEPVYAALNDTRGLIRFVGTWDSRNDTIGVGANHPSDVLSDFIEITIWGTGVNILDMPYSGSGKNNQPIYVDGILYGSIDNITVGASILSGRNYCQNRIRNVCAGLTLGLHTIKIVVGNCLIFGFEVLNINTSGLININPGNAYNQGIRYTNSTVDSISYSLGATGSLGGRMVRYISGNDTISYAFTACASAPAYMTSADHTNEEVARVYHWREFGAGRYSVQDDFSLYTSGSSPRAFTLEDGTTTLVGTVGGVVSESVYTDLNQYVTLTFVGTGVDVNLGDGAGGAKTDTVQAWIDGSNVGNMPTTNNTNVTVKLASGLSYGTHTLKLLRTVNSSGIISYKGFKVYQPKKPTIPSTAIEIADYNIMANYGANTTATINNIATGILRKSFLREAVYTGTYNVVGSCAPTTTMAGFLINTTTIGAYVEYTFFGKGFEARAQTTTSGSSIVTVSLQSLSTGGSLQTLNSTNFPGLTTSVYGGTTTFTYSTGVWNQNQSSTQFDGAGISVSGLALGVYKVRFTQGTTNFMIVETLDIITPIHTHKSNLYGTLQNTLPVGSTSILDTRATSYTQNQKAWAQASGVYSSPSTSAGVWVPLADMSVTIKTEGGPLHITFFSSGNNSGAGAGQYSIYLNGVILPNILRMTNASSLVASCSMIVPVPKGIHKIDAFFFGNGGTYYAIATDRALTVREL